MDNKETQPFSGENDFKYIVQDMSSIYLGARYTYGELIENEDVPHKLKEVIFCIFLKEVAEDTTPENHVFYLDKDSASYRAYKKMKARFRMSVWYPAGKGRKKAGYINREYALEDVVGNRELAQKMNTIVVEEVKISKLGLGTILV